MESVVDKYRDNWYALLACMVSKLSPDKALLRMGVRTHNREYLRKHGLLLEEGGQNDERSIESLP